VAVHRLIADGIETRFIGAVASDAAGTIRRQTVEESGDLASAGAVSGAASGLLVGGLVGLLIGATVLAVPPIGFVVAGPIAGLLTGAGVGMVSGGVLGAMIGLGIPEESAHVIAESIRRGGTVVSVSVEEVDRMRVEQILAMAGAVDLSERGTEFRQAGFKEFDPHAPLYTADEISAERTRLGLINTPAPVVESEIANTIPPVSTAPIGSTEVPNFGRPYTETTLVPEILDDEFRREYEAMDISAPFEKYRPAFRFGYELANRGETPGLDWTVVEPQAKSVWEHTNPGTWLQYGPAIHIGWSKAGLVARQPQVTVL
jgi:hypothetical protein